MRKRILIVDDEEKVRSLYRRTFSNLEDISLQVFEAGDAWEAVAHLIQEDIDLVLLDLRLPQIDGRKVFHVINRYAPRIEVIVASVYPVDLQRQMIPQARDYYDKSEGTQGLKQKVLHILRDGVPGNCRSV